MGARTYYGQPDALENNRVTYEDGTFVDVATLKRPDLLRLAGVAGIGATVSWSNERIRDALKDVSFGGRVPITCACGHEWRYRIKRPGAETWLKAHPCPPCRSMRPAKDAPVPEPEPEPEPEPTPEPVPEPEPEPTPEPVRVLDTRIAGSQYDLPDLPEPHHEAMPTIVRLVKAGLPVWLQGPPGTAKSTLAHQVADYLGLDFYPESCHEYMTRSDLMGYRDANGTERRSPFWDAFEHGGLLLLDELDNGNSNLVAGMNSALSNGHATFGGRAVEKHEDFRLIATANTSGSGPEAGYIGRMGVDAATLDRFVRVPVPIDGILEETVTTSIAPSVTAEILNAVRHVRREAEDRGLRLMVSPRASYHIASAMTQGFSLGEALEMKLLVGVDAMTRESLLEGIR